MIKRTFDLPKVTFDTMARRIAQYAARRRNVLPDSYPGSWSCRQSSRLWKRQPMRGLCPVTEQFTDRDSAGLYLWEWLGIMFGDLENRLNGKYQTDLR